MTEALAAERGDTVRLFATELGCLSQNRGPTTPETGRSLEILRTTCNVIYT
jgi:hypothetical protein